MNGIWPVAITTLVFMGSVSESFGQQKMYWTQNGIGDHKIQRANLDGSEIEDVTPLAASPIGLALDLTRGWLYWTAADAIRRTRLDEIGFEVVIAGPREPAGIALDLLAGKMYWVEFGGHKVQRANLDGSQVEDLVTSNSPAGIALDLGAGKMYWTGHANGKLRRANLDGTQVQDIVVDQTEPLGIALDLRSSKVYWTQSSLTVTNFTRRANFDGTGAEDLIRGGRIGGIALDIARGKMYLVDIEIFRTNLDGSELEVILGGGKIVAFPGIALDLCGRPVGGLRFPDHVVFVDCLSGPASFASTPCHCSDFSGDVRVDLKDYALLQRTFTTDE